jgi:hypothetical protein
MRRFSLKEINESYETYMSRRDTKDDENLNCHSHKSGTPEANDFTGFPLKDCGNDD